MGELELAVRLLNQLLLLNKTLSLVVLRHHWQLSWADPGTEEPNLFYCISTLGQQVTSCLSMRVLSIALLQGNWSFRFRLMFESLGSVWRNFWQVLYFELNDINWFKPWFLLLFFFRPVLHRSLLQLHPDLLAHHHWNWRTGTETHVGSGCGQRKAEGNLRHSVEIPNKKIPNGKIPCLKIQNRVAIHIPT